MNMRMTTYFIGNLNLMRNTHLSCDRHTHLAWDLPRALDWLLVTLSVLLSMTIGSCLVTMFRLRHLGLTLLPSMFSVSILTNNSGSMVDLGVGGVAMGGEGFLTLFYIGCVNNGFADCAGDLALIVDRSLVALSVLVILALGF